METTITRKLIGYGPLASHAYPSCASDAPRPFIDESAREAMTVELLISLGSRRSWADAFDGAVVKTPGRILRKLAPKDRLARVAWVSLALQVNPRKVSDALAQEAETWDDAQTELFNVITSIFTRYDISDYDSDLH
jgi:hypothetical protein